jgi:hypothetical protein
MSGFDRTSWKNYLHGVIPSFNFLYQANSSPSMGTQNDVPPTNLPLTNSKPIRGGRSSIRKRKRTQKRRTQK